MTAFRDLAMDYTAELNEKQIDAIEQMLQQNLIDIGVNCVLVTDLAGNMLISLDNGSSHYDVYSLAALAAGNFGAVSEMARLVGEDDFSLLFHKGDTACVHFSKAADDLLLIAIFGKDISLGFVRLKVSEAVAGIQAMITRAT